MVRTIEHIEEQFCGTLVVLLIVVVCVSLSMVSWPLLLALCLPFSSSTCEVHRLSFTQGVTNCSLTWSSCQDSCSSPIPICKQIYVKATTDENVTLDVPLFANVVGCGYDFVEDCAEFFDNYSVWNFTFPCHIYLNPDFAVPDGQKTRWKISKYLLISIIPLIVLILSCVYMKKRKMFARGYKKVKKQVVTKKLTEGPRSFYQKKLIELEFKKSLRELKMKNTQNDVKVFDLERAQTTGALLLRPTFSQIKHQPPKIIV